MITTRLGLLAIILTMLPFELWSQSAFAQVAPAVETKVTIEVGQPTADAVQALRLQRIKYSTESLALSKANDDIAYLTFDVDAKQAFAVVYHSKSKLRVVGISLVVFPEGRPQKSYRVWLDAQRITLSGEGGLRSPIHAPKTVVPLF